MKKLLISTIVLLFALNFSSQAQDDMIKDLVGSKVHLVLDVYEHFSNQQNMAKGFESHVKIEGKVIEISEKYIKVEIDYRKSSEQVIISLDHIAMIKKLDDQKSKTP